MGTTRDDVTYQERLIPPAWAWAVVWLLVFVFAWAFKAGLGWTAGIIVFVGVGLLATYGVYRSSPLIEVTADELKVGKAHIGWYYTGRVATLDPEATHITRTTGADPRAFHVMRPLTSNQAVTLELLDDEDPHPYWIVSTRQPLELAQAISRAQSSYGDRERLSASAE
ncbi:MAG: DUF3093 domain-containing protein [Candidatus Nanopelagicales bacterium]